MAPPKRSGRPTRATVPWTKPKTGRNSAAAASPRRRGERATIRAKPAPVAVPTTASDVAASDPTLFAPLTPGECADAVRTLTEDRRVAAMAKVGRYRVIATEPLVVKPPHWIAGHRLARVVVYDYAADRCVDACVDLDAGVVAHLDISRAQPMLSREEESEAISVAQLDSRVRDQLTLGEAPLIAMHYWGIDATDPGYSRRAAAVMFGQHGGHPSLVAVVDLIDNQVTAVVPAAQW
jgi:Cu2+-containing amine oxidase